MSRLANALEAETKRIIDARVEDHVEALQAEIDELRRQVQALAKAQGKNIPGKRRSRRVGSSGKTAKEAGLSKTSIRRNRKRLGLTQAEVADMAGVTPVAVYLWESGRTVPAGRNVDFLLKLSKMAPKEAQKRAGRI